MGIPWRFSAKIYVRCKEISRLIAFLLTPGQESDIDQAESLMERGTIRRHSMHLRLRPKRLVTDKGIPVLPCEAVSIFALFVALSLGVAMNGAETHLTNYHYHHFSLFRFCIQAIGK